MKNFLVLQVCHSEQSEESPGPFRRSFAALRMTVSVGFVLMVFLFTSSTTFAGTGLIINEAGDPLLWEADASTPIDIHPESGTCGRFTNAQVLTSLEANLEEWTGLSTVGLSFNIVAGEIDGVDGCNYTDYLVGVSGNTTADNTANVNDGLNPILFDDNGELVDEATGEDNGRYSILGFANPAGFTVSDTDSSLYLNIVDGQALFNCYCADDGSGNPVNDDCPLLFTDDDLDFTQIHEMGHFLNLDHTQVNNALYTDATDDNEGDLPTMFPVSSDAGEQLSPNEDDIVAMSSLYPSSAFFTAGSTASTYCKVTGTLLDRFGDEMRCADVQMVAADIAETVAFVSGAYAPAVDNNGDADTADLGECDSDCGDFILYLKPGTTYTFTVASINSSFTAGSGISPCADTQITACTDTLITNCTDDSTSTSCRACVKDETIATNAAASNIAAIIAAQCTAGATVSLGDISSNSVSKDSASTETLIKDPTSAIVASFTTPRYLSSPTPMYEATDCSESGGSSGSTGSSGCALACTLIGAGGYSSSVGGVMLVGLLGIWGFFRRFLIRSKS